MAIKGIPGIFDTAGASATGAAASGAGLGSSVMGILGPVGAFTSLVGLFKSIDENKRAKQAEKDAEAEAEAAAQRFANYAQNFQVEGFDQQSISEMQAKLKQNPALLFDPTMQFTNMGATGIAGGMQFTPGFDTDSFSVQFDPSTGEFVTTTTSPKGKTESKRAKAPTLSDLAGLNLDAAEIDKKLNQLNQMDGVMDVPYWESQPGFEEAVGGDYQSTNPNSKYYDPEAEYTGPKPPNPDEVPTLVTDENGNERLEFPEATKKAIAEGVEKIKDFLPTEEQMTSILDQMPKTEDGQLDLDAINEQYYTNIQTGGSVTDQIVNGLPTPMGSSIKQLYKVPLGGQLYPGSNIQNPFGRFRDVSGIIQDRSDLVMGENARTDLIQDRSALIRDLTTGAQDFSGIASDTSTLASNTMADLQIATQTAQLKSEQADQALANQVATMRVGGFGASGATAIAQAAAASKLGIAADIEQQEARNNELRARGQQQVEQIRMNEARRLQDIQFGERLRLEQLRQTEGRRLDDTALAEARRVDQARFDERGRQQQIQLQEALRTQAARFSEQQALREADVAGIQYQQGIAEDRSQRNLDRLANLQTQSMVNQQAAEASRRASAGAITGGFLQLAGTLGASLIKPGG